MKTESGLSALNRKLSDREFLLQVINRDLLKYIALILMTMGHWVVDIYKNIPSTEAAKCMIRFFLAAQYFAPPVFMFFITEGFHYTRSKKKYAIRLLAFAVITQIPHAMTYPEGLTLYTLFRKWSVIMTLFLGLAALIVLHCGWKLPLRLFVITGLMGISWLLGCEWAVGGIVIMLFFDLFRDQPLFRFAGFTVLIFAVMCVTIGGLPNKTAFFRFIVPAWTAGIFITFFYNGKKGRFPLFSKYFFYVWYPLHLFMLGVFQMIMA